MRIESELKLDYSNVLIRPKRSKLNSRSQVDLMRTFKFTGPNFEWTGIPVVAANMDTIGTLEMSHVLAKLKLLTAIHKHYSIEAWTNFVGNLKSDQRNEWFNHVCISTGTSPSDCEKTKKLFELFPQIPFLCIDVANGYSEHFVDFVKSARSQFPQKIIIAGNVVTADMTQELILAGANIVKVGIGGGSACLTRPQTGIGYPQLSAVIECSDAAHGLGGMVMADGGCTCVGDVAKSFAAGSDFSMLGGMLAGHAECMGKIVEKKFLTNEVGLGDKPKVEIKKFMEFYGMSSDTAMRKHHGGLSEYRSSEGATTLVPYKGNVEATIKNILGGMRSTLTYVGAQNLKQLSKCTTFVQVDQQYNTVYSQFKV